MKRGVAKAAKHTRGAAARGRQPGDPIIIKASSSAPPNPRGIPCNTSSSADTCGSQAHCSDSSRSPVAPRGPTIRSNVDQSVDFTRFRTFDFLQPLSTDREGYQSFVSRDLMVAAEREMTALGFQRTSTNPDLLVNFSANLDQRLRVTQTPTAGGGAAWGSHRRGASYGVWGGYRTDVRQDTMGTLGVDVIDAARRQLVWEGVAVSRITRSTAENIGPALDSAVRDIFTQFPARVGK